jgi:hypothetical protein
LKWRYRDENAQFDLNWSFFFFVLASQPIIRRQNGYNLVTQVAGNSYTLMMRFCPAPPPLFGVHLTRNMPMAEFGTEESIANVKCVPKAQRLQALLYQ